MNKLKFECTDCKSILCVDNEGKGQGEHKNTCILEVKNKCACGHNIQGTYSEVRSMLEDHLIKECQELLCPKTRKLMRVVHRFGELGVPANLVEFYKNRELTNF
jgi:hypothetical protein